MGKWMTERTYEHIRDFVFGRENDIRDGIEDFAMLRAVKMWLRAVDRGERDMIVPPILSEDRIIVDYHDDVTLDEAEKYVDSLPQSMTTNLEEDEKCSHDSLPRTKICFVENKNGETLFESHDESETIQWALDNIKLGDTLTVGVKQ